MRHALFPLAVVLYLVSMPTAGLAADEPHRAIHISPWAITPFILLLLTIAILPLFAHHFWESNRNKAIVVVALSLPMVLYLVSLGWDGVGALLHELSEYASFIILLAALYTVAGGISLTGDLQGKPTTNTAFLATGAVFANFIGTTGASMLLIRPVLRINQQRRQVNHIPVFFIFVVSNLGGLLTPLGDPPLFLGFLKGVNFFWTLSLWPQWLVANGIILGLFYAWDTLAYRREKRTAIAADVRERSPLRLKGLLNLVFLAGILAAVLLQSPDVAGAFALGKPWGELIMASMAAASWFLTRREIRIENRFTWHAIVEVAVLFAGIFATMVPALLLLEEHGDALARDLGVSAPWHYFWLTGVLSSLLDNAPTYVTFATLAAGGNDFGVLARAQPNILAAISCGAVFMGANTYIGNGPNFMVKAIADQAGYRTPSFFGYLLYSGLILLPTFVIITLVFFVTW